MLLSCIVLNRAFSNALRCCLSHACPSHAVLLISIAAGYNNQTSVHAASHHCMPSCMPPACPGPSSPPTASLLLLCIRPSCTAWCALVFGCTRSKTYTKERASLGAPPLQPRSVSSTSGTTKGKSPCFMARYVHSLYVTTFIKSTTHSLLLHLRCNDNARLMYFTVSA